MFPYKYLPPKKPRTSIEDGCRVHTDLLRGLSCPLVSNLILWRNDTILNCNLYKTNKFNFERKFTWKFCLLCCSFLLIVFGNSPLPFFRRRSRLRRLRLVARFSLRLLFITGGHFRTRLRIFGGLFRTFWSLLWIFGSLFRTFWSLFRTFGSLFRTSDRNVWAVGLILGSADDPKFFFQLFQKFVPVDSFPVRLQKKEISISA